MSTGAWVLVVTTVVVTVIGGALRWRSGRVRPSAERLLPAEVRAMLPAAAGGVTLLQLSTTFCAPCRQTRVLLGELAARTPGLHHVELDLTLRPELAEPLRVRSTPTTLAVDAAGHELLRLVGVPRRDALLAAVRPHLPAARA